MEEQYARRLRCMSLEDAKNLLLEEGSMESSESFPQYINQVPTAAIAAINASSSAMSSHLGNGNDLADCNLNASMRRVQTCPSELHLMNGQVVSPGTFSLASPPAPSSSKLYNLSSSTTLEPSPALHPSAISFVESPQPFHRNAPRSHLNSEPIFPASTTESRFGTEHSPQSPLMLVNSSQVISPQLLPSSGMDPAVRSCMPASGGIRRIKSSPVALSSLCLPPPIPDAKSLAMSPPSQQNRLAKKAEAARLSRLRKKAYVQSLEEKVTKLTARLAELQTSLDSKIGDVVAPHEKEQEALKSRMHQLLELNSPPQAEIQRVLDEFVGGSRKRQSAVDCFLKQADSCVAPMIPVKFAMWGLGSDSEDAFAVPGVWTKVMCEEVGVSNAQMHELNSLQGPVRELRKSLENVQARIRRLKESVRSHVVARHSHLDELRSLLTPEQVAKFVRWIDLNPLCMQMLEAVWPR